MVICLERSANDLHYGPADATATLSSLALLKSRLTFLVLAYPGCAGKEAVKRMSVCLSYCEYSCLYQCSQLPGHSRLPSDLMSVNTGRLVDRDVMALSTQTGSYCTFKVRDYFEESYI